MRWWCRSGNARRSRSSNRRRIEQAVRCAVLDPGADDRSDQKHDDERERAIVGLFAFEGVNPLGQCFVEFLDLLVHACE